MHNTLHKTFRFTTGEQVLRELGDCIGLCAGVTFAAKTVLEQRRQCAAHLEELRSRLEVVRAYCTLAWELKSLSHNSMAQLNAQLDVCGRQTVQWRQWLAREGQKETP